MSFFCYNYAILSRNHILIEDNRLLKAVNPVSHDYTIEEQDRHQNRKYQIPFLHTLFSFKIGTPKLLKSKIVTN